MENELDYWKKKCETYKLVLDNEAYARYWRVNDYEFFISDLKKWLIKHESDISNKVDDFSDLRNVFIAVLGRKAGGV